MKNFTSLVLIFCCGAATTAIASWIFKNSSQHSYRSANSKIRKLDSYRYDEATNSSLTYFFTTLPQNVKDEIQKRDPKFEKLTSCEGEIISGRNNQFAVSYVSEDKSKVLIFEINNDTTLGPIYDISDLVDFKIKNADDYLEVQCKHTAFIFNNSRFHLINKESRLAEILQRANHVILQVRSRQSNTYGIFAFDSDNQKFHQVGTIPVAASETR